METEGFMDMAVVKLHPYGNARETAGQSGEWNYQCQHGEAECQYNLLEACALGQQKTKAGTGVNNHKKTFEFIACIEGNDTGTDYDSVATTCANNTKNFQGISDILTCYKGSLGNQLEHKIAQETEALNPPHQYVPWIVVNGQHTDAIQNSVGTNLLAYVCQNYTGANKAAACS